MKMVFRPVGHFFMVKASTSGTGYRIRDDTDPRGDIITVFRISIDVHTGFGVILC